uniref:Regulator of G protein signaling 4 n=1 Tax=Echeneis naucrates TaxID=173247 RepID=A0A665T3J7_ECHNA
LHQGGGHLGNAHLHKETPFPLSLLAGRAVFTNFLRSEFSEENMDFWLACEDYKTTASSKLVTRAKQIYQQFIEVDAPNEVNLDGATKDLTRQNIKNSCPSCFNEAQRIIYLLMEKDSYRRFLNSKLIQVLFHCSITDLLH